MSDKKTLLEKREISFNSNVELRKQDNDDGKMILEGKAVAFNSPETYYGETEIIDPHALDEADMSDVVLRYNHSDQVPLLARTRNNSLKLEIREDGLYFVAELLDTTDGIDFYKRVNSGLIDKCSFAFIVEEDKYNIEDRVRTITKISHLFDTSLVDFPFYNATSVEAKCLESKKPFLERAKILREEAYKNKKNALLQERKRKELLERL